MKSTTCAYTFFLLFILFELSCSKSPQRQSSFLKGAAFAPASIAWQNNEIPVCFEPVEELLASTGIKKDDLFKEIEMVAQAKQIIKDILVSQYNERTLVEFTGFETCPPFPEIEGEDSLIRGEVPGVYIYLGKDSGNVNAFGKFLDGLRFGLNLPYTFLESPLRPVCNT